jgi:hypothetical protein
LLSKPVDINMKTKSWIWWRWSKNRKWIYQKISVLTGHACLSSGPPGGKISKSKSASLVKLDLLRHIVSWRERWEVHFPFLSRKGFKLLKPSLGILEVADSTNRVEIPSWQEVALPHFWEVEAHVWCYSCFLWYLLKLYLWSVWTCEEESKEVFKFQTYFSVSTHLWCSVRRIPEIVVN